ncbi:hypothetical protein [Sinorhizobium alkalisoli]|uniref:hypothetical protein n=1 Tax=Sinorhizobium alkalisoli TaxID=1752398 RepID=UPI0010421B6A|nr:hypothetical protein [Sinorhizobium alkalisoli]MCG5478996.1 hypothetical protein [Sinorhizobium alkalisoli]
MVELAVLLTIGYLGGCFGHLAWLFLSSVLVLFGAPIYLVGQMGIASPFLLICLTLMAIATIQSGSLTGLLKARTEAE